MARDFSKIKQGACAVTFGGTDIGHTQGGCNVSYDEKWRDMFVDEYGEGAVDKVFQGESIEVTMKLTQSQLATIKAIMPLYTDGTSYLGFGTTLGKKASDYADELILTPFEDGDATNALTIFKALTVGSPKVWGYTNENDRVYEVTWVGLMYDSGHTGSKLFKMAVDG